MFSARGIRIDRVIHPESDIVGRIYNVLAVPGVSDIRDFAGAIVRPYGEVIIPRGSAVIAAGDRVVFFAAESCVAQLESDFLATAGEA